MTDEEYFAHPGISNSFLNFFDRSSKYAKYKKLKSKAIEIGKQLHCYLLEPERFDLEYIMAPPECDNRRDRPYPEFKKENPDREIVLYKEYKKLERVKEEVYNYELFEGILLGTIIKKSEKEVALFWEEYDIQRKAKLDLLYKGPEYTIICDVKKTQNCSDFPRHSVKYKYDRQAATYIDGAVALLEKPAIFYFITIEDEFPNGVIVYRMTDEIVEIGRQKNLRSIENYKKWDGKIRGYEQGIHIIDRAHFFMEE